MNDQNLTRLVVGNAFELSLGIPVGQHTKTKSGADSTLRWRKGKWEQPLSLVDRVRQLHSNKSETIELKLVSEKPGGADDKPQSKALPAKSVWLMTGILVAVLLIALTWWTVTRFVGREATPQLPIATTLPITAAPVNAAEETFPFPDAKTAPDLPVNALPSPIQSARGEYIIPPEIKRMLDAKPTADDPAVTVRPDTQQDRTRLPTVQDARPGATGINPSPITAAAAKEPKTPPQAVILDVDTPSPKAAPTTVPIAVTKMEPASKATPAAKVAEPVRQGTGLVALTQDGLSALFTNPKNRLPEKFGIGDKIPNGETIKSIDKAGGRVVTDAKEYKLE